MSNKILLSIAVTVGIAIVTTLPVQASVVLDSTGTIVFQQGAVLGESSDDGESDDSEGESSGSGSSGSSNEEKKVEEYREKVKQNIEKKYELDKKAADRKPEHIKKALEEKRNADIHLLERKYEMEKKRIEENGNKYILDKVNQKIRVDLRDGQARLRVENHVQDGSEGEREDVMEKEMKLEAEHELEIEPSAKAENTRLRALRSKAIVERLRARAISTQPLSVDPETNTISITTPSGDVKVVVLPDAAIQNLLASDIVDEVVSEPSDQETQEAVAGEEEKDTVRLEAEDDKPVYKIAGIKRRKFLGVVPFESKVDATVSAETGEVFQNNQPFMKRLLAFFSTSAK